MNKYLIIFLLFFIFYFLFSAVILAQDAIGIKVSPALIEERVDPGQTVTSTLRFTNIGSVEKAFYLVGRDISGILENTNQPIFAEPGIKTGYELSSWIEATSAPIMVLGNETKEIEFVIKVPEDASPGSHIGVLLVSTKPESEIQEIGSAVGFEAGPLIMLRISGEIFEEAKVREFFTDKALYSRPNVKFTTKVENPGNVLIRPRGPVDIINFMGKTSATIKMNNDAAAIFPKAIREFQVEWNKDGIAFGRYQAVMSLVYGDDGRKTVSATASFWVLPLHIIFPVFGGILILILGIYIITRLYIKKKVAQIYEATKQAEGLSQEGAKINEEILPPTQPVSFPKAALWAIGLLVFVLVFVLVLFMFFA